MKYFLMFKASLLHWIFINSLQLRSIRKAPSTCSRFKSRHCQKFDETNSSFVQDRKLKVTFVTGNVKKYEEVKKIVAAKSIPIEVVIRNIDLPEFQGDPIMISREKCRLAAKNVNGPVMVEDTSLCLDALNGMPGPYIKWFIESIGNRGIFNLLQAYKDKGAYAQCSLSFSKGPDSEPITFVGKVNGTISEPIGANGFGWDTIFVPEGYASTLASLTPDEKNEISHRYNALMKFTDFLEKNMNNFY